MKAVDKVEENLAREVPEEYFNREDGQPPTLVGGNGCADAVDSCRDVCGASLRSSSPRDQGERIRVLEAVGAEVQYFDENESRRATYQL